MRARLVKSMFRSKACLLSCARRRAERAALGCRNTSLLAYFAAVNHSAIVWISIGRLEGSPRVECLRLLVEVMETL